MKDFSWLVWDEIRDVRIRVTHPEEDDEEIEFIKSVKFKEEGRIKINLIDLKSISKWFMTRTSSDYTIADPQDFYILNYRLTNISGNFRKELLRKAREDYPEEDYLIDEVLNMTEEELLIQLFHHSDTSKAVEKCIKNIDLYHGDLLKNQRRRYLAEIEEENKNKSQEVE